MTDQQYNNLMAAIAAIGKTVAPIEWNNFLVSSGQSQPTAPTEPEIAANPGKYYGTKWDILAGSVTSSQVVELFSPPTDDGEGGKIWKFVSGTFYQWAKADLAGFMLYYQHRYKVPLDINVLHPEQRAMMGL